MKTQVFKSEELTGCTQCSSGKLWIVLTLDGSYIHFYVWADAYSYARWLVSNDEKPVQAPEVQDKSSGGVGAR